MSFSLDMNLTSIAKNAIVGAGIAPAFGASVELGAALGAISGMISTKITMSPAPSTLQQGPYAHVFHSKRDLRG